MGRSSMARGRVQRMQCVWRGGQHPGTEIMGKTGVEEITQHCNQLDNPD